MRNSLLTKVVVIAVIWLYLLSCYKVPVTGRRQLNLLPESEMIGMSASAYSDFLSQNPKLPSNDHRAMQVARVGKKIADAVEIFMNTKPSYKKRLEGFNWQFNTVEESTINAWCMPGGKVVVYTGILPLASSDAMLAVVLGHEIAHAIARHGNERMSQQLAIYAAGTTIDVLTSEKPQETRNLFLQAYGVSSTLGMLAYSRKHESEADKMGLVFMAIAGYDPAIAVDFWKKMAAEGGAKPPELLSTHPSDERRIEDIKTFLPEARKYYTSGQ